MAAPHLHANQILRRRRRPDGRTSGLPGYYAFTHGENPSWWSDALDPKCGDILGVFEDRPGSSEGALVITREALVVLESSGARALRYKDIADFTRIVKKNPLDTEIEVITAQGTIFKIPVSSPRGAILTIWRFLIHVCPEKVETDQG